MRILVIQTGTLAEVVESTVLLELLIKKFPGAILDVVVNPLHAEVLERHPHISNLFHCCWNKSMRSKSKLVKQLNQHEYGYIFSFKQSLLGSLFVSMIKGKVKTGLTKAPLSFVYKYRVSPGNKTIGELCEAMVKPIFPPEENTMPRLYPTPYDYKIVERFTKQKFVCIDPVTKTARHKNQVEDWVGLIKKHMANYHVYLLGRREDWDDCEILLCVTDPTRVHNLAGKLTLLELAALLKMADKNFLNNTGFRAIAETMNAPAEEKIPETV